jgi:hypothetical protein
MKELKVKITFTDELLGTASGDPELHETYIASKAPDARKMEEEIQALGVDEVIEKKMTVFPRLPDGTPFIWDYQIRGFFKAKCSALRKVKDTKSSELKSFKKEVDELIFVTPRQIPLRFDGTMGNCQRPLRASTPQGERVALSNSESVPEGAVCEFAVSCYNDDDIALVSEWLDMGCHNGLGQWRNAGKGRFTWEEIQ